MKIFNVNDPEFKEYGRVVENYDFNELLDILKKTPCPDDTIYIASDEKLEATNSRDSEINICADNIILLLAKKENINPDFSLDTSNVKAFLVPANTAVEIYATTLHYAPCHLDKSGFRVAVVLPRGTNFELKNKPEILNSEDKLLTHVNKWLIAHSEGGCPEGSFIGLTGKNINIEED